MNRPIDPRRPEGPSETSPPEPQTKAPTSEAPPQDAVEAAVERFVDSILPESRTVRRGHPNSPHVRRAS